MTPHARPSARGIWLRAPFVVWLVVLWMLLWGQITWLALITGIAVAAFVMLVYRLPTVELSGRVNPWHLAVLVVLFLAGVVRGALQVSWIVVRAGPASPTAVIRVPLVVDDDLIMTHTSVVTSLIPGSLVVEVDRASRILYLHVIGATSPEAIERMRGEAQRWERRIVRALGSTQALALVRDGAAPVFERRAE
ncbi:MAG: Na+/H+ antiporter subunit E [Microbacterium sp.]